MAETKAVDSADIRVSGLEAKVCRRFDIWLKIGHLQPIYKVSLVMENRTLSQLLDQLDSRGQVIEPIEENFLEG